MDEENRIDTDNPVVVDLEFASSVPNEVIIIEKEQAVSFNANVKAVITQELDEESEIIESLTVGQGIVIVENTLTITIPTDKLRNYSGQTVYLVTDPYKEGYRDYIINIKVKYSPL